MKYYNLIVKVINYLVRLANNMKLAYCAKHGSCICSFCTNKNCKIHAVTMDQIISVTEETNSEEPK